jgi:hypothetical protein
MRPTLLLILLVRGRVLPLNGLTSNYALYYIHSLTQVLIHSELLSTHIIVLFMVSNQNVPGEM